MKLTLKILLASFLIPALAVTAFFFWAGAGVVKKKGLAGIRILNTPPREGNARNQSLKIMTYNCGYFSGMMNNLPGKPGREFFNRNMAEFQKTAAEVKPDVICFQEIDQNSRRSHFMNQAEILAESLGFSYHAWAVNWNKRYVPFPYWPPSAHFGKMVSAQSVISKYPVTGNRRIVLEKADNPFYYNHFYLDRLIQEIQVDIRGRTVTVMNVHLEAFDRATREKQARFVMDHYLKHHKDRGPVIILGDFNCVPPEAEKQNGFPDEPETDYRGEDTIPVFYRESSLTEALPGGDRNRFTFPTNAPDRKLDYIFYSNKYIEFLHASVPGPGSSDHFPVVMEFRLKGETR